MDYAFIAAIESWGAGGQMMDIVTLTDGQVLLVLDGQLALYPDRAAFEAGSGARVLARTASAETEPAA